MYDDHPAGVPVGQDRPQHGRADAGPVAPHTRDGHGLWGQEGSERPRLCLELLSVGCVLDPGGAGDAQVHGHDALIGMLGELVTGVREDLEHRVVLDQHLRLDPMDPTVANQREEVLEEKGAEALAAVGVRDQQGDLDRVRTDRLGRRKPHETTIGLSDQSERLRVGQHVLHIVVGGPPETLKKRIRSASSEGFVVQGMQSWPVVWGQSADDTEPAVGQYHVGWSRQRSFPWRGPGSQPGDRSPHDPIVGLRVRAREGPWSR